MDAFKTHQKIVSEYKDYLKSFINIYDKRITDYVNNQTLINSVLPDPLIQFNPSFAKGKSFDELIDENIVHPNLSRAFGKYRLYRHQVEAIEIGVKRNSGFVVTSGTGSGKSLTFLATIFNDIFKEGTQKQKGVKAILVYPMNALINSQFEEINKYKSAFGNDFPITFAQYTGQESGELRNRIKEEQPDIILTNYMMLELIMTRQSEKWLRDSMKENLKYVVYDELHTYRGRQGADVSILNRRIQALAQKELVFIGTSATMASQGSPIEKKQKVAEVATQIFGKQFDASCIINEYLEPCTKANDVNAYMLANAIEKGINIDNNENEFVSNDLANWLEMNVALTSNSGTLERGKPLNIEQITDKIHRITSQSKEEIKKCVINLLKWAEKINEQNRLARTRKSFLPFRFHQFISQTGSISVTLEPRKTRVIVSSDEPFIKVDGEEKKLFPLLFSRYSGYDFLCVELNIDEGNLIPITPNKEFVNKRKDEVNQRNPDIRDFKNGYIVLDEGEDFWNLDYKELVPTSWLNNQGTDLSPYYRMLMPRQIYFNSQGQFSFEPDFPIKGYFIPAKLTVDPTAQIIYEDSKTSDFTKLSRLGSEGRSTATSVISYAVVKSLVEQGEDVQDQKLLSFTDNRQDASLQAGHFNDFYTTIRLRSALYAALKNVNEPLDIESLPGAVFNALNLKESQYAVYPSDDPDFPDDGNSKALKLYLTYRVFQDLKRGWRYTLPNLEQVALLEIDYKSLDQLVSLENRFKEIPYLYSISVAKRKNFLRNILEYFRTNFALEYSFFREIDQNESFMKDKLSSDSLWSLDHDEKIEKPSEMVISMPRNRPKGRFLISLGHRSNLGKYINRCLQEEDGFEPLNKEEYNKFLEATLKLLKSANMITIVQDNKNPELNYYRLRVDQLQWIKGDEKTIRLDHTRFNFQSNSIELKPNSYFLNIYKTDFAKFQKELIAKEHTGQISSAQRIEREEAFRKGQISTLFCSPTMELGIDIANLNIVHMRNVPPNAANYAQRSGRAGRGGQTALVFTYCSTMSPHDVNYFKNSTEMVAGSVQPPRIDLVNEELIASHLNAFLLMNLEVSELKTSAAEVLDLTNEQNIFIKNDIQARIELLCNTNKSTFLEEFKEIALSILPDLNNSTWFTSEWIESKIERFPANFSNAFTRWIRMFQNACTLRNSAQAILDNHIYAARSTEKKDAERQERFARKQIALLKNESLQNSSNSEFYIFRYLAAEGFLPGYNFTRLPVRAVLGKSYKDDVEVISRPRNLALSEFGPLNTVYHSGNKYRIGRMITTNLQNSVETLKISKKTGYGFFNEGIRIANVDPITKTPLNGDSVDVLTDLLEFSECEGIPIQKISCIEEERSRSGYDVVSYFNFSEGKENTKSVVLKNGGTKTMQIFFSKTASLIKVNKKLKRSSNMGFRIDKGNGNWLQERQIANNAQLAENSQNVKLYVKDTADILYIQPLGNIGATPEQVISLSFALKRGIEKLFLVEESEISVSIMGDPEKPNILINEASEGSLGILSQLISEPLKMKEWFKMSYSTLHYDPETRQETEFGKTLPHATYQDLLSYYNQIYHKKLNRHDITQILENLMDFDIDLVQGAEKDRDEQYQYLLDAYDKNSSTERKLIEYLYKNGYALPDLAQVNLNDYYISADFVFGGNENSTLVFCDGSIHDTERVQRRDEVINRILAEAGADVIRWRHTEPIEDLIARRKDIFRKVK